MNDPDEQLKPISFAIEERDLILKLLGLDLDMEQQFRLAQLKNAVVSKSEHRRSPCHNS